MSSASADAGRQWTVLLPVRATTVGKSRLAVPAARRAQLARALALDTATAVAAAARVRQVVALVEDDDDGALLASIPGVTAYRVAARGLNEAINEGLEWLLAGIVPPPDGSPHRTSPNRTSPHRTSPQDAPPRATVPGGPPVAVLPADLPSLRPEELDAALATAATVLAASTGAGFAVVADHQGTGTTLLAATRARLLDPHYGPGSFAAHRAAGAVPLPVAAAAGLRRDVDVVQDLAGATGPRTATLVRPRAVDPAGNRAVDTARGAVSDTGADRAPNSQRASRTGTEAC